MWRVCGLSFYFSIPVMIHGLSGVVLVARPGQEPMISVASRKILYLSLTLRRVIGEGMGGGGGTCHAEVVWLACIHAYMHLTSNCRKVLACVVGLPLFGIALLYLLSLCQATGISDYAYLGAWTAGCSKGNYIMVVEDFVVMSLFIYCNNL